MSIRVTVWNEFRHEQQADHKSREVYPNGLHMAIADALKEDPKFEVTTATLDEPEQGLPEEKLNNTDVLVWWGHCAHAEVKDELVERIAARVRDGMGIIVLHSGHYSKVFRRLMGTECRSKWWEENDRERIFTVMPGHPITAGLPEYFELPMEETYCEHFNIPTPDELVFISWFSGGAVLRSGCCYHYGAGKIFYFQPGHETFPTYYDPNIRQVLKNAAGWAAPCSPAMKYGKHERIEAK
ncbi:MAG: ThuA domain-containing protein [Clostridiales bacterium]|nr:ThuA domain-containing protein [Clostridiales bacterium]